MTAGSQEGTVASYPEDVLGLVVGTVPATPLRFSVGLAPGQYVQLDDVVVTTRPLPGRDPIQISGVVTNVEAVHEGARFASDVFLIEQGVLPAEIAEVAEVTVTRVDPELYVPPLPGTPVHRAAGLERDKALYFDTMGPAKVPLGFGRDGQPVYANFEFIDGTRGAHVSISGISGIATKTSFAMFLLHSIINCGVLEGEAHNTKILIFSVKGEDLLFLDYANSRLTPEQTQLYTTLNLPATPFKNVRVFAPPRKDDPSGTPDVTARDRAVSPFYWTLTEFCKDELLPFAFADAEDERAQYTMLVAQVAARLRRDVIETGQDGAIKINNTASDRTLRTFRDLVDLLEAELTDEATRGDWIPASTPSGSVNALLRRLYSAIGLHTKNKEQATIAALPFLSHRYAVRAAEVLLKEFAEHALDYAQRMRQMVEILTQGFTADTVNIVTTHATLLGGRRGGGERDVQTRFDYELPASIFPVAAHYVALGHLHRQQEIPGPCPIFYSGAPLAVDFGEEANDPAALIITATPDTRADPTTVPVIGSRPLRTLRGSLDEVIAKGEQAGDAYLRVILAEPARAGLGDLVREKLPNALEVELADTYRPAPGASGKQGRSRVGRSPVELFGDYLDEQKIQDPRLTAMFAELLDELTSPPETGGA